VLETPRELLHERDRLKVIEVELPVARDERGARTDCYAHPSASKPGSRLPSRNSRLAPPPVDMCPKLSSWKPKERTAAAESPPPTAVRPADSVSASATVFVPCAKASNSNTPMGPFQKTVAESRMTSANAAAVSGPISRPRPAVA